MDPFLGHFWGSKMTPFWPNPVYSSPRPERGGFRGVSKNDPKMTLFKKCQKVSKMTVFRPLLATVRGSKNGVKNDPKNDPFLDPLFPEIGCKYRGKWPKMGHFGGPKSDPFLDPILDPLPRRLP